MSLFVVDSSIVAKWFFNEVHSAHAVRLAQGHELVAPAFAQVELANIAIAKLRRGQVSEEQSQRLVAQVQRLPVRLLPDADFLSDAYALARAFHPSVYDCLYAAVGVALRCQVVTADRRFFDTLSAALPELMLWVEDIPEVVANDRD